MRIVFLFFGLSSVFSLHGQTISLGILLTKSGEIEYTFDEPNPTSEVEDSVWLVEGTDRYLTDFRNVRYDFLMPLESPSYSNFLPSNLDPSTRWQTPEPSPKEPTASDVVRVSAAGEDITISETVLDESASAEGEHEEEVSGADIDGEDVEVIRRELHLFCQQSHFTSEGTEEFMALRKKLSALDENNYLVENAKFILDRGLFYTYNKQGLLAEAIGYMWDQGVERYTLSYDEASRLVRLVAERHGMWRETIDFTYNAEGKVIRFTVRYHYGADTEDAIDIADLRYDAQGRVCEWKDENDNVVRFEYSEK